MSGEDSADLSALTHMIAPQGHASTLDDAVRAVETNAARMLGADEDSEQDKCVCLVMLDAERSVTKQARMPFSFVVDALQRLQAGRSFARVLHVSRATPYLACRISRAEISPTATIHATTIKIIIIQVILLMAALEKCS